MSYLGLATAKANIAMSTLTLTKTLIVVANIEDERFVVIRSQVVLTVRDLHTVQQADHFITFEKEVYVVSYAYFVI